MANEKQVADENWQRYEYGRDRGHDTYCQKAKRLEGYYLGGGEQWEPEDLEVLRQQKRPALEFNEIKPAVNSALGYQIANRLDIAFQPRGGMATQELSNTLSKLAMQVAHNTHLHWRETDVFADGLIQRRGFFEIRIRTDDHMRGEVDLATLDPLDVIPDPDAKAYEPDGWSDVLITRWLTLDEIEALHGKKARSKAEKGMDNASPSSEADFGDHDDSQAPRNKFGDDDSGSTTTYDAIKRDKHLTRLRVIDRQKWEVQNTDVLVSPDTGDVRVFDQMDEDTQNTLLQQGWIATKRRQKRVRWIVSTWDSVLHNDWSPYPFFTVIPFFPYFRRGKTRGMVDDGIGPQNALNKGVSQYIHIVNTTANSGWLVEENSLSSMDTHSLEANGAKSGIVLEYKKGSKPPEKIKPNAIPAGVDKMIERLTVFLKEVTVPDSARGIDGDDQSGIAVQSRQFAAQQQLAPVLDNLGRTRRMLATAMLWLLQTYYDDERIIRITKPDPATGEPSDDQLVINQFNEVTGQIDNDLRIGEYDVVISEQPTAITFESAQFEQAMRMRAEAGILIPDDVLVRSSTLADKADIVKRMAERAEPSDPLKEAETALKQAQADETRAKTQKTRNEAVTESVESQYSAIQTAQTIAQLPQTAPLADSLLKSAGFVDQDAAPIIPSLPPGAAPAMDQGGGMPLPPPGGIPHNPDTNPMTPSNPAQPESPVVGAQDGIEGGEVGDA